MHAQGSTLNTLYDPLAASGVFSTVIKPERPEPLVGPAEFAFLHPPVSGRNGSILRDAAYIKLVVAVRHILPVVDDQLKRTP